MGCALKLLFPIFFMTGAIPEKMNSSRGYGDLVGLNVGGIIYKTSSSTLLKNNESFFSQMLEGYIPSTKDDDGNFIIDRDGQVFRHILNFMRCGSMVVPEDFKEYTLLEHEADFYSLWELQKAVQEAVSSQAVTFVFDNHDKNCCSEMLFRVTKKALSREDNSLFSKILRGEAAISRDSQGNFVMERDGSLFRHVNIYLKKGAFFSDVDARTMKKLEKEAAHYELGVLHHQIKSILAMSSHTAPARRLNIHVYWWVNGPCAVFANKSSVGKDKDLVWNISGFCKEDATICGGVFAGIIDKEKTMPALENIEDIFKLIQRKTLYDVIKFVFQQVKLGENCIRAVITESLR